jgi:long-chain acyl-CoA synthetase
MLLQMLHEAAARRPDAAAIVCGERETSYAALLEQTERFAHGLAGLGVAAGDRVALVHGNAPEFVTTFFAVTALGATVVPLNPGFQAAELRYYFDHCAVRAVVTDEHLAAGCLELVAERPGVAVISTSGAPAGTVPLATLGAKRPAGPLPPVPGNADAVYQYSSGSTGRPKRVPRTHEQCWREADSSTATLGLGPDDRIFCAIPLFHTHGQGNCLLAAVHSQATLLILEDPNPFLLHRHRALDMLTRRRATVFPGVPFLFRMLADTSGDGDLSALRLCYSAGTALQPSIFEAFQQRFGVPVRQLYGCTEAGALTINLDPDPTASAGSVGRPLDGVRIEVVDEARRPVPPDATGEIAISTPAMTRGYHGMDELNREVFQGGFFYTGDVGRLDAEGRLWITGRKKLFIEVAGNKVDPIEVEDVLVAHPTVEEAVVVGLPGKAAGEEIVKAVVVATEPLGEREVIDWCRARLARFKVPQLVEFRAEIPKSPLGKVLRKYLV